MNMLTPHDASLAEKGRVTSERLVDIPVLVPQNGDPQGIVILVAKNGATSGLGRQWVDELGRRDLIVLPVDLEKFRAELNKEDGECMYLGSDLEGIAKEALRSLGSGSYFHPVVAGIGEGGTLAYAALANAPAATLAGAVALDPADTLNTAKPTCEDGAKATPVPGSGFSYALNAELPNPAVLIRKDAVPVSGPELETGRYAAEIKSAQGDPERLALAVNAVADLAAQDAATQALPIIDIPAQGTAQYVAVFYSGDGGWRDIDKSLGEELAKQGVHVVGVDSLRYFWSVRKPEEIARDTTAILKNADPSGKLPIALLGYSFGADTLPFAWPHLPEKLQARVRFIGLLGTEMTTPFQVSVENWLGLGGDNAVAPAIAALPPERVLCVYGVDEDATACTDPALDRIEKLKLDGGHHFDGDYESLAGKLLDAMTVRMKSAAVTQKDRMKS